MLDKVNKKVNIPPGFFDKPRNEDEETTSSKCKTDDNSDDGKLSKFEIKSPNTIVSTTDNSPPHWQTIVYRIQKYPFYDRTLLRPLASSFSACLYGLQEILGMESAVCMGAACVLFCFLAFLFPCCLWMVWPMYSCLSECHAAYTSTLYSLSL